MTDVTAAGLREISAIRGMVEQCYGKRSRYPPQFAHYADKEKVCLSPETVTALLDLADEALRLRAVLFDNEWDARVLRHKPGYTRFTTDLRTGLFRELLNARAALAASGTEE